MRKTELSNAQKKDLELKMAADFRNGEKLNPKSAAKKYDITIELSAMLLRNVKRRAQLAGEDMAIYIVNNGKEGEKRVDIIDNIPVTKNEDENKEDINMVMTNFTTTKKRSYTYNSSRMTDEVVKEMKEYLEENPNTTIKDLAEMVGFSPSTVSVALKKAGFSMANRKRESLRKKVVASNPESDKTSEVNSETKIKEESKFNFTQVADNRVYVGLCSERHNIPVTEYIFSSEEVNENLGNITYLDEKADKFVSELEASKVLVVYCTGLQPLLVAVMKACCKYRISLICMHHDPATGKYKSQDAVIFDENNSMETPFDYYLKRGAGIYCNFDLSAGIPDKLFVVEKVAYSPEDKTIMHVDKYYFTSISDALSFYSEIASKMYNMQELIGIFVNESNNFGDGAHVIDKTHQYAKAFNFDNDYQKG